jgi:dTDP-4-dehydrorhamnose 3,5-epimerase
MKFLPTELPGVVVVEPRVLRDERGFFLEFYHQAKFREGGIDVTFVQDNHSRSARGTLRGLHAQLRHPQGKLVRVVAGEVWDVATDIRRGSPTFARWVGVPLSTVTFRALWVPPGFAHGFCVLSEHAEVEYKSTALYDPGDELAIAWNDPELAIAWPIHDPLLSARDRAAPLLAEVRDRLPAWIPGA